MCFIIFLLVDGFKRAAKFILPALLADQSRREAKPYRSQTPRKVSADFADLRRYQSPPRICVIGGCSLKHFVRAGPLSARLKQLRNQSRPTRLMARPDA